MKLAKVAVLSSTTLFGLAAATLLAVALQSQAAAPAIGPADDGDSDGPTAHGIVTQIPSGTVYGLWTIGGNQYDSITGTTEVRRDERPLGLNRCAEVNYRMEGERRIALRIRGDDDCGRGDGEDRGVVESKGVIESFPSDLIGEWRVSGISYTTVVSTYFAQRERPFRVGTCVEILHPISSTVAIAIKSDDDCDDERNGLARAKGTLQSFPPELTGTWTVNSVTYQVLSSTLLNRSHGDFFVGACVEVHYNISDTERTAVRVATEGLDDCGDKRPISSTLEARGLISNTPVSGTLFGTWTIGGQDYQAISGTTRFKFEHGIPEVGDCAKVRYMMSDTLRIATRLESEERHDCRREREESKFYGAIKSLPATPNLVGPWVIGNHTVTVTSATVQSDGPFSVGMLVEVKFTRSLTGELIATKIEGKRNSGSRRREGRMIGILQDRPISPTVIGSWIVNSTTFSVTASTRLTGSLEIGNCVLVRYSTEAGQRIASKIRGSETTVCAPAGSVISKTYGFVDSMPASGFIGTWVIGGTPYEMSASTEFEEEHGAFAAGAFVKVEFRVVNGVNVAREVETEVPPQGGDTDVTGVVATGLRAASADAPATITVGGQTFVINEATLIIDDLGALVAGAKVSVNAYTNAAGEKVATSVAVLGGNTHLPLIRRS